MHTEKTRWIAALLVLLTPGIGMPASQRAPADPCTVRELKKSDTHGLKIYAPDGRRYLVNKEDAKKIAQVYVGQDGSDELTCITCEQRPDGPRPQRFKMMPVWHPSGKWIFMAAERDKYKKPPILGLNRSYVEGTLQSGIWTNMYAVSPDGRRWTRLTDFQSAVKGVADGYVGPQFTADGKKAVWSQIISGNILVYRPFGRWELIVADYTESRGLPAFKNLRNITPNGMHWNEPGDIGPDGESLLLSGSAEKDQQGQDQFILNIRTGALKNLTNTPTVWDEHGHFSPDGRKIAWMSSYPYREDKKANKTLTLKTEFMLMNADGTGQQQLTRFKEPGSPEFHDGIAAGATWSRDGRSLRLNSLVFPDYAFWDLAFEGACGKQ